MEVLVNVKKLGKRKNAITQVPYQLESSPATVRELIEEMVRICVRDYNKRMESRELLKHLSLEKLEEQAASGKISFGVNYGEKQAEEDKTIENALQCFEDGIYRIFCGERPLQELGERLALSEGSELTFVRLTMLAGRMW